MDLKDHRIDYTKFHLTEEEAGVDPFALFKRWFDDARETEIEANVMIISTIANDQPQTRVVLLKEVFNKEFVFYTNYLSQKGRAIEHNPHVSLLFFWQHTQRQVRIDGTAQKVSAEQSDEYFYSRPIESQIGAIVSQQSSNLDSREFLENKFEEVAEYYKSHEIKRPEHWGGYTVKPNTIEFWQGRPSRLHDRICFHRSEDGWKRNRLYP